MPATEAAEEELESYLCRIEICDGRAVEERELALESYLCRIEIPSARRGRGQRAR